MSERKWIVDTEWFKLDKYSLYDKIINIRMTMTDDSGDKKHIIIRSDWMPVFNGEYKQGIAYDTTVLPQSEETVSTQHKTYSPYVEVKRVLYKPDISVSMKTVGNDSRIQAIRMELTISNFFMLDLSGSAVRNFGDLENGRKITDLAMEIGYMENFRSALGDDPTVSKLIKSFDKNLSIFGIQTFRTTDAFYIRNTHIPPDSEIRINAYVGSSYPMRILDSGSKVTIRNFSAKEITEAYKTLFRRDESSFRNGFIMSDATCKILLEEIASKQIPEDHDYFKLEYDPEGKPAATAVNELSDMLGLDCKFSMLGNGDCILYVPKAEEDDEFKSVRDLYLKQYDGKTVADAYSHKVPAAYNISYAEMCFLEMPFFYWANFLDRIELDYPYAATSGISYYMGSSYRTNNLIPIWSSLDFATVKNRNKVTIKGMSV